MATRDPAERAATLKRARETAQRNRDAKKAAAALLPAPEPVAKKRPASQEKVPGSREIANMTREDHIEEMIEILTKRMRDDDVSDGGLAQLTKARTDLLTQLEAITGKAPAPESGLSEFERKLNERQERRKADAALQPSSGQH